MKFGKLFVMVAALGALSGCGEAFIQAIHPVVGPDKTRDRGRDAKHLSQLVAGIHVDPDGCDHWIIDDGVEGYYSPRVDKYGHPVCSGIAPPNVATGPFKGGDTRNHGDPL